ncbi:sulfatase-like hydrolase/transferase [Streptomyces sp. NBRC 110028]|uniref:sulfatase-like hydrolase/transferase n=1 Tax=Streptomyces sp. NBRC 110028 TaxID=1621260 RepID=UPI0006E14E80|nr:sulfatase-like hydrolase/transferase [Streptomyces sp. NBRC 110028]
MTPPNFVIIVPDQLRADALGCFGNDLARTPHIDALAERGTVFEQTYVQHPVCSPSRASFLTGWYPHVRGHRTLTHLLQPDEPNLLRILKDAGYHVTWAGTRGDALAPGVTELSAHEYGLSEKQTRPGFNKDFPSDTWARVFYRGRIERDGLTDHDEAAVRTAERWLAEPPSGPWVLFVPLFAPHCPFQAEEPWFSLHDRAAVPAPVPPSGGPEPGFKEAIRRKYGLDRVSPEMWREVAAVYHGMVSRLDDHVGRIQAALRASGADDRTVSLFFADHGEYLGDYGLIEKWPSGMDPCITRDPLIVSGGGLPAGQRHDGMVELVDVLPTVLELAGVTAPHRHFGRSLVPVLHDPGREHRRYAFTEGGFAEEEEPQLERPAYPYDLKGDLQHERPHLVGKAVAVRDRDWTYVWRLYEPPELYHRRDDPHETVNLAGRPEHTATERRFEQALLRWQVETADIIPAATDPRFPPVALAAPAPPPPTPA